MRLKRGEEGGEQNEAHLEAAIPLRAQQAHILCAILYPSPRTAVPTARMPSPAAWMVSFLQLKEQLKQR